jgi:tRNA threonylcarbamoyl adenosine modification protein (Sua5/YciO/YrdC/YwlC family)
MASLVTEIHSITPQPAKIQKVVAALRGGAVMLYPTDTGFALGCCLSDKAAISRVRQIRRLQEQKQLTFLCDSLTNIAEYAQVSNHAYRTLKRLIPGPYTFILPATKAVPRYAVDAKRKTTGIRVPQNQLVRSLLEEHGTPIISITAKHPDEADSGDEGDFDDSDDYGGDFDDEIEMLLKRLEPLVDVVIRSETYNFQGESTVVDMTSDSFQLVRRGAGIKKVLHEIPDLLEAP